MTIYSAMNVANGIIRDGKDPMAAAAFQTLMDEIKKVREELKKWKRIRTPTHGSCCTCQECGLDYESCRCDLDDVVDDLDQARKEIARLQEYEYMYKGLQK